MQSTMMLVIVGNAFLFSVFFSLVSTVSASLFVTSFSNFVSCSLAGSFPGIILNKCEQILFLLGFCVFNAVMMLSFFHWHLLHSSLSRGNKFLGFYTGKKKCVRDGSGGRVFSGCPGCYLGNIRVSPYNRDVAIILLPTECAASFSCSRVYCVWLSGGYIRQRCVVDSNSLNPSTERLV